MIERNPADDLQSALRASEEQVRLLLDSTGEGIYGIDLEGKKAEEATGWLAAIAESSWDAMVGTDPKGMVTAWNPGAERIFGYCAAEVMGKPLSIFAPPDRANETHELFEGLKRGQTVQAFETVRVRKDGNRIDVSVTLSLVRDRAGRVRGISGVIQDITQRRAAEEQLRQAQKMEAIGQLSGGIAHDFNNLLTVVLANADMLADRLPEGDARREDVDEISKAAESAATLTRQLLAFSRRQVLEPRVISLNGVVTGMEKMLRRLIGEHIEFSTALRENLGHIYADAGQLEQVIMNLAVNARDAMPRGGKLRIDTMDAELDETYSRAHVPVKPGRYAMMSISDTGCGMDPETQSHIFEPFFTTKEKGTGLGLSTCYGIVKQSAGFIWVYSEPGVGTTFKIYLPRVDREVDAAARHKAPAAAGGSETILVVEDEESLREVTRRILQARGYSVLLACDGAEGLAMCAAKSGPIDLIVSDVVTPTLGGTDMAQRLLDQGNRTPVLFMSGYVDKMIPTGGVLQPGVNFIQKPFGPEALARKVREMLDGKKAA
jgi:PAS domain S-box-containing protein